MVLHGITMYNMPLICHIFGQEKLQQILQNGGVSKQHFARLRCRMVGSFTRDLRSISYIYPCIEFGRLGCACIIFKCLNECYHFGSSKLEPK